MFLLLALFVVVFANKIANNGVMRIDQEYKHDAPKSSWITIELAHPGAKVKSILWCKSITPNPKHAGDKTPAPINDCKGSGLTHLQLYPSDRERVRMPPEEPNVMYIDPEEIGGWDPDHQYSIIVTADIDKARNAQLMQVVRFNAASMPAAGTAAPVVPVASANGAPTSSSVVVVVPDEVKPTTASISYVTTDADAIHPWLSVFIVFGVGLFILLTLGSVAYVKKAKKFQRPQNGGLNDYEFDKLPVMETEDAIEMQTYNADMTTLMQLGTGAKAAFAMNLK